MRCLMIVILGLAVIGAPAGAPGAECLYPGKKLIEYGWDRPDTAFVREHIREMEQVPFDGVVMVVKPEEGPRCGKHLGTRTFSTERFVPEDYEHAIADLRATKFARFTDNFIQMLASPGKVDWFDPAWPNIAHNAACLARVAKQGGCKGLMFDTEDYGSGLWNYNGYPQEWRAARSFEEYVAKIRERGKEFIRAVNAEYPDITILCLIGPSISYEDWERGGLKRGGMYSLLSAFFDGMCEAATPGTIIVDGYEQSYPFRDRERFQDGRRRILELTRDAISTNPAAYEKHMRAGFGVWADYGSGSLGWHPEDFSKNYYTPEQLRASLAYALEASDGYVWVYTQKLRWWDFNAPREYVEALALAKSGPGPGEPNPMELD